MALAVLLLVAGEWARALRAAGRPGAVHPRWAEPPCATWRLGARSQPAAACRTYLSFPSAALVPGTSAARPHGAAPAAGTISAAAAEQGPAPPGSPRRLLGEAAAASADTAREAGYGDPNWTVLRSVQEGRPAIILYDEANGFYPSISGQPRNWVRAPWPVPVLRACCVRGCPACAPLRPSSAAAAPRLACVCARSACWSQGVRHAHGLWLRAAMHRAALRDRSEPPALGAARRTPTYTAATGGRAPTKPPSRGP